jgi:hypothetical protein
MFTLAFSLLIQKIFILLGDNGCMDWTFSRIRRHLQTSDYVIAAVLLSSYAGNRALDIWRQQQAPAAMEARITAIEHPLSVLDSIIPACVLATDGEEKRVLLIGGPCRTLRSERTYSFLLVKNPVRIFGAQYSVETMDVPRRYAGLAPH